MEGDLALPLPRRRRDERDRRIAAVDEAQDPGRARLRLERDDAGAEAPEGRDAVADMGADVEGEIAGLQEARIERTPSP